MQRGRELVPLFLVERVVDPDRDPPAPPQEDRIADPIALKQPRVVAMEVGMQALRGPMGRGDQALVGQEPSLALQACKWCGAGVTSLKRQRR
jgi:hypothetical protein